MIGLGKPFRKKSDPTKRKNGKNRSKIAACEQKPLARKRLKLERKNFTPQYHSLFRFTSGFGVTKITTPN